MINELEKYFPNYDVMDALGIIYPQYLVVDSCEENFVFHLGILKSHFGVHKITIIDTIDPKTLDQMILYIFNAHELDYQSLFFKMTMTKKLK